LQDIEDLDLPHFDESRHFDVFQNYVVRTSRRDELAKHLESNGVETLIHWPKPVWEHPALGLGTWDLPETVSISQEVVSLPMSAELTEDQATYVISKIRDFFAHG
jgi:dTDP-4-amino-4,6-dideoxygalactose transaminase